MAKIGGGDGDPGPASLIEDLNDQVMALNLQKGISNSLGAKLDAGLGALEDVNENNNIAAINALNAFISSVQAQIGKQIAEEDEEAALALIQAAQEIINILTEDQ